MRHRPMDRDTVKRPHVWVDASGGYRHPGLVITWQRPEGSNGWEAYGAMVLGDGSALVTWQRSSNLHPVTDDRWQSPSANARTR